MHISHLRFVKTIKQGIFYSTENKVKFTTYYGSCKAFGEIYTPDIHPIVTYELWQQCQEILRSRDLNPHKVSGKPFQFRRLITCSACGSCISFIEKKNRYVYAYCDTCRLQKRPYSYLREETLIRAVSHELQRLRLNDEMYTMAVSKLAEIPGDNLGGYSLDEFGTQLVSLKAQISRLMDLYLEGGIDSNEYSRKLATLRSEEAKLTLLKERKAADMNPFRQLAQVLTIVQNAPEIFRDGNAEIRRKLLEMMFHSIELKGRSLVFTVSYAFDAGEKFQDKKNGRLGWTGLELMFRNPAWAVTMRKVEVFLQAYQGSVNFI